MSEYALEHADLSSLGGLKLSHYSGSSSLLAEASRSLRKRVVDLVVLADLPLWVPPVIERINEFGALAQDWDTYGGLPVSKANARHALDFLARVMGPSTPLPWIAPLGTGGLQLDWGGEGVELEVVIDGSDSSALIAVDDDEQEVPLGRAIVLFPELAPRLSDNKALRAS